jgi:hypothetical protein
MKPGCPTNCFSNENNDITLTGWISEWILLLHIEPMRTLQTIIDLGFSGDITSIYIITRNKDYDWMKYQMLRRNVVHAFMFGEKGVGKVL